MQYASITSRGTAFLRRGCFDLCGSLSKGPSVRELEPLAAYVTTVAEQTHWAVITEHVVIIVDDTSIYLKLLWVCFFFLGGLNEHLKERYTC